MMPVHIDWENEAHTVVRMELIGDWTWKEVYDGSEIGYTLLESADHVVNVIIDLSKSTGLPLLALTHARNMIPRRHPRTGLTVFVGANELFLTLWRIFSSAYKQYAHSKDFSFARDVEEAYAIFAARQTGTSKPA